jgi:hypothetical protein
MLVQTKFGVGDTTCSRFDQRHRSAQALDPFCSMTIRARALGVCRLPLLPAPFVPKLLLEGRHLTLSRDGILRGRARSTVCRQVRLLLEVRKGLLEEAPHHFSIVTRDH